MLLPGIVIVGCFIFFVLTLTGLIQTSIILFGPNGGVNGNCNLYVISMPFTGVSVDTLAYLEQKNICRSFSFVPRYSMNGTDHGGIGQSWQAAFAFEIVGVVFDIWMMVMASQVNKDQYD